MKKNVTLWFFAALISVVLAAGCGRREQDGSNGKADGQTKGTENSQAVDQTGTEGAMNTEEGTSQLQLGSAVEIPESFDGKLAETKAHAGLERAIADYCGVAQEDYPNVRYYYNYVDLNGDGKNEILALVLGQQVSGIEGNALLWLHDEENQDMTKDSVRQAFRQVGAPVYISNHMTGGYRDLIIADGQNGSFGIQTQVNEGNAGHTAEGENAPLGKTAGLDDTTGQNGGTVMSVQEYTLLIWTGEKYQEIEEGTALSDLAGYEGTAILTNNIESDFINDNYHFLGEGMR